MAADGLISEGDHLVLDVNGEKLSFVQKLKATGKVRVGKYMVPAAPLVGAPYGALFEVTNDGKSLQRVLLPPADEITRISDTDKNNSGLFDRNSENQKLTQEQIEELKKSGKSGAEIIQALCCNSATFQNKTEFSQDKYKKRKAKKYLTYLTVRKPCARILCEAYYDKAPERVANLRHDSMAVMLSLANVAAGAKVLVAEQVAGVLTAAAVERLGGKGVVCALQVDERVAPLDAVRQMNLSVEQRAVLFTAPAGSLLRDQEAKAKGLLYNDGGVAKPGNAGGAPNEQQQGEPAAQKQHQREVEAADKSQASGAVADSEATEEATAAAAGHVSTSGMTVIDAASAEAAGAAVTASSTGMDVEAQAQAAVVETDADGAAAAGASTAEGDGGGPQDSVGDAAAAGSSETIYGGGEGEQRQQHQRRGGGGGGGYGSFLPRPEQLRAVLTTGFDSCLVALPRIHPTALLAAVWPLLAPSATFAIFSPWPQPLAEALTHLQTSRNAVLLQLQESWLRPYQVLPSRTHPLMSCAGTGGYILSGVKTIQPDATPLEQQLKYLYSQPQSMAGPQQLEQQQQLAAAAPSGQGGDDAGGRDGCGGDKGCATGQGGPEGEQEHEAGGKSEGGEQSPGGGRGGGGGGGGRGRGRGRGGWGRNSDDGNGWRSRGRGWGRGRGGGGGGKRPAEGAAWTSPAAKRQAT